MPRTAIPITEQPPQGSTELSYTAVDAANGMKFPNDGQTVLVVKNSDASGHQVTVVSVADPAGRTGDEVRTVAAGAEAVFGPFRPSWWNQDADPDQVYVDFASAVGMEVAALRLDD